MKKVVLFLFAILCYNCLFAQFKIQRSLRTKDCIQGYLFVNTYKIGYTIELPWNDNDKDASAIPEGTYNGTIAEDATSGWIIKLYGVPFRSGEELHIGDYPWNSKGSVLLGTGIDMNNCTVSGSADAMIILKANVTFQRIINKDITFEFTTIPACTNCDDNFFFDTRDNKTYKTVKIGAQTWMAENLNYASDGSWCYDGSSSNCNSYGRLYTYAAANTACPTGWHLPSDDEWTTLTTYLGGDDIAGGKLKSTSNWTSPNTGATNISGFTALPGGYRNFNGSFNYIGNNGHWWSSTEIDQNFAWSRLMHCKFNNVLKYDYIYYKSCGLSVRCLMDL